VPRGVPRGAPPAAPLAVLPDPVLRGLGSARSSPPRRSSRRVPWPGAPAPALPPSACHVLKARAPRRPRRRLATVPPPPEIQPPDGPWRVVNMAWDLPPAARPPARVAPRWRPVQLTLFPLSHQGVRHSPRSRHLARSLGAPAGKGGLRAVFPQATCEALASQSAPDRRWPPAGYCPPGAPPRGCRGFLPLTLRMVPGSPAEAERQSGGDASPAATLPRSRQPRRPAYRAGAKSAARHRCPSGVSVRLPSRATGDSSKANAPSQS